MPRAAMRHAKLVRHNGQDVQNLFVGTRVVVNFRLARDPPEIEHSLFHHGEGSGRSLLVTCAK
jgi:hypothetical protein